MNYFHAAMLLGLSLISGPVYSAGSAMAMQVGEVRVLAIPDVARVAVGDGHVVNAVTTEEKEVIVFARNQGASTLQIWLQNGVRRQYQVQVAPQGARQVQQELGAMMQRIPNAMVSSVGDKIVVEGDELADNDRARVAALARKYPQLIDMTGHVGWDRMVLLDVQVVELPRSRLQELGLRWAGASDGGVNAGLAWEAASSRLADRPGEALVPAVFPASVAAGYFGMNALLSARIHAMAQSGSAVVLAQPQLLARSGATAEFLAGGEVPYSTTDANGNTNTVFKPYGVSLKITPHVERNGAVRSRIEVEVSSVDTAVSLPNGPSLKTRRAATEFNVRSGQTLVLAGFLSREVAANRDAVPGLSDLPLIGQLFGVNRHQRSDTELAIFVTPVLADADHPDVQARVLSSSAVLEQHFSEPPLLNLPIRQHARLPLPVAETSPTSEPLLVPGSGLAIQGSETFSAIAPNRWNPRSGKGSQWVGGCKSC